MPLKRITLALIAIAVIAAAATLSCGGDDTSTTAKTTQGSDGTATVTAAEEAVDEEQPSEDAVEDAADEAEQAADQTEDDAEPAQTKSVVAVGSDAPELRSDPGGWINSTPLSVSGSRGSVVLIDFWTYTCINCIRTLPYLKAWHDEYSDDGLRIIGVHTPEFEFEKVKANVEEAVAEFGLEYPVIQDNDYLTWRAYNNRAWPAKYLIDKDGTIRYTHIGEGAYDQTEEMIKELLAETGSSLSEELVSPQAPERDPKAYPSDSKQGLTRELYAGSARSYNALYSGQAPYFLQVEFYDGAESEVDYEDPGDHANHFLYIHGLWRNGDESLVHARETESFEDYVALSFYAREVNAVMSAEDLTIPYEVHLTLDGAAIDAMTAGADVMYDEAGNSYVLVDTSRMYNLVDSDVFAGRELKLSSNSDDFTLFAFTFGAYKPQAGS